MIYILSICRESAVVSVRFKAHHFMKQAESGRFAGGELGGNLQSLSGIKPEMVQGLL